MHEFMNKQKTWLLPATLILFILEVIAFPFALGFTWAGRSETPERFLTYTHGKLTWDSAAGIGENGAADLSLFETLYQNVKADNSEKVIAPGTKGDSIVRLKNSADRKISYTAVLYRIRTTELLPVEVSLSGDGFADTTAYTLPEGVKDEDVIRGVSGMVGGGMIQDFDIEWYWRFFENDARDIIDTWLGDKAAGGDADDVTVGLYIVVEEDGGIVIPDVPQTGDTGIGIYVVLMCVSGAILLLLIIDRKRGRRCEP